MLVAPRPNSGFVPAIRPDPDLGKDLGAAGLLPGQVKYGNINTNARPVVHNRDGTISTVRSITIGPERGGLFYVIPTVVGPRVVSNTQAVRELHRSGQYLGVFTDAQSAERFAQALHLSQAQQYGQ